ncbi:MAG TPA: hypothetical protein VHL11_19490 [Phototrophicaceae bacterium]|jgi:hypothetical protein|nr:hypothetical protein [Phototrophicaceae bacterium]
MTATTRWLDDAQTILGHEFVGKWSTEEFEAEVFGATPQIVNRGEKITVVINVLQYTMPTRDVNIFALISRFNNKRPANIQMIVFVVQDPLAFSLLSVARRLFAKADIIFAARSMESAMQMIAQHTKAN